MLLLFILIFFVSTVVFFGTYKLWSYLQLSSVLDREINHLWQRAPDKLKVVVERYLVLKFAGNKARVFNILCQPSFHKSMWPSSRPSKWMVS
jgi:tight adherence protein C